MPENPHSVVLFPSLPSISSALPRPHDVDTVIKQLEKEFAPSIPGDDPIRLYLRGFELMMHIGFTASVETTESALREALGQTRAAMDETASEKLKLLNDELIRYAKHATAAINEGRNQANSYLLTGLVEMQALVKQLQSNWVIDIWKERVIGLAIAGAIFIVGFLVGNVR